MNEQANTQLSILYRLARDTSSTFGFEPRLRFICGEVRRLMQVKGVAIHLVNEKTDRLSLVSACGLSNEYLHKGPVLADRSLPRTRVGEVHFVPDVATDPTLQYPEAARKEGIASILALPLLSRERFIGTLRLYTADKRAFAKDEIDFLTAICAQAAVFIENARTYETIRKQDASKNEFILMMTHELKSPLMAMQSILDVLRKKYVGPLTGKQEELLERMHRRIDSILEVSTGLLDRFQWESRLDTDPGLIDLKDQVRKAADLFSETAGEKRLALEIKLPADDPVIQAIPGDMEKVINNLVSNALKYTPPGGAIRLDLRSNADAVILQVADTGIGIEPGDLPRIFEDNFRAGEARRIDPYGRGLGLSFVKKIVESLNGKIAVESHKGEGTTFRVVFPRTTL